MFDHFNVKFFHDSKVLGHTNLYLDCTFVTLYSKINMIYEVFLTFVLTYRMITRFVNAQKTLEFINS